MYSPAGGLILYNSQLSDNATDHMGTSHSRLNAESLIPPVFLLQHSFEIGLKKIRIRIQICFGQIDKRKVLTFLAFGFCHAEIAHLNACLCILIYLQGAQKETYEKARKFKRGDSPFTFGPLRLKVMDTMRLSCASRRETWSL